MLIKKGKLLEKTKEGEFDVVIYPCNCFHTPTSIMAKNIRETFSFLGYIDKRTPIGDKRKLGCFTKYVVDLREIDFKKNKKITIINGYLYFSNEDPQFEYKHLRKLFRLVKHKYSGKIIAFPLIGLGLKDISINKVCEIIDEELKGEEYYMVIDAD
jgi:hypothetical protein